MESKRTRPYPAINGLSDFVALNPIERAICWLETTKQRWRTRSQKHDVTLQPILGRQTRPLTDDDIPLIFLCHDGRRFLPSFLKHYRQLGVTRFLCVEDKSTDGSREYLAEQPDVDTYESNVRYGAAGRGRIWRQMLVAAHGFDRWYLNVDVDEYLVYDGYETMQLPAFLAQLRANGLRRASAPMIDCYPAGALLDAHFDGSDDSMPWTKASLLDSSGYTLKKGKKGLSLDGGGRLGSLGVNAELMKHPIQIWHRGDTFGKSVHWPIPYELNFSPIHAVLLHFKFFSDYKERIDAALEDNQYYQGAQEYRKIGTALEARSNPSMENAASVPYVGSSDLVSRGFIAPLP